MRRKFDKTASFTAIDDAGRKHTINEITEYHDASGLGDTSVQWEPVSKAYQLDNGNHVNLLDDGTMLVVRTGMRLRRM